MRTHILVSLAAVAGFAPLASAQDAYPIAYNLQFTQRYEYLNTMSLNQEQREYYTVFVVAFQNKGTARMPLKDDYEIVTAKGEKHKPKFAPFVKKNVQDKRGFKAVTGKVDSIEPGETKYNVAVFDALSDQTPAFRLFVRGLPDLTGTPSKFQIVAEYQRLPQTIFRDATNARDPTIIWEKDQDPKVRDRYYSNWRQLRVYRLDEKAQ
jgi:hypothetical protein